MTNPYRDMCAELVDSLHKHTSMWEGHEIDLVTRARALLDQPDGIYATITAALRAAADQVAPSDADEPRNYLPMAIECQRIRTELLAIAAELEAR